MPRKSPLPSLMLPPTMRPGVVERLRHQRKLDDIIRNGSPVPTSPKARPKGKCHKKRKAFATPDVGKCIVATRYARTLSHLEHKEPIRYEH